MNSSWTFGRRIAAGFGLAALTLAVVALAGYRSTQSAIENNAVVARTHQTRRDLATLLSVMKDAETGQRGYLLTGSDSYLEPYQTAIGEVDRAYDQVLSDLADDSDGKTRFTAARQSITNKLAELKTTIDLRRTSGLDAALRIVTNNTGKQYMDQLRAGVEALDEQEVSLLKRREEDADASSATAKMVILWGTVAGLAFMIAVGWFITSSLTRQIGAAVQHIQSSSAELQAAANQQVSGTREQATAMTEITTTISELLATSRQIAESAQRVARIAGENATAARTGEQTVQSTHEAIAAIKRQVDLIVTHMLDLGKKSQQIGGILEIINELAEQTNILAINATIEAAGAGDAGKRFAVVADEIRKLADRVGASTKEIRGLIDEVRAAVNTTVMATEGGTKAVDAGAHQFTNVTATFKQIAALVSTTTDAAREIELSTKQQSTAVEQVNLAVANVSQATKETEASSGQTFQTATQLTALSRELVRVIRPEAAA